MEFLPQSDESQQEFFPQNNEPQLDFLTQSQNVPLPLPEPNDNVRELQSINFQFGPSEPSIVNQFETQKSVLTNGNDNEGELEEEDEDEHEETLCGVCGGNYASNQFWICCDICEKWFHGKCVKITSAMADRMKEFKCPACVCSNKIAQLQLNH